MCPINHRRCDLSEDNIDIQGLQQSHLVNEFKQFAIDDSFVNDHMSLVESIAAKIFSRGKIPVGIEFQDMVSWGVEGLVKAARKYKEGKGTAFKSYAYYRIRGEISDHLRSEWQYRNQSSHKEYKTMIQDRIADVVESVLDMETGESQSPAHFVKSLIQDTGMMYLVSLDDHEDLRGANDQAMEAFDEQDSDLWQAVKVLEDNERQIVELFYVEGLKQKEIADRLNYSKSKVCRIHLSALKKLRKRLEKMEKV